MIDRFHFIWPDGDISADGHCYDLKCTRTHYLVMEERSIGGELLVRSDHGSYVPQDMVVSRRSMADELHKVRKEGLDKGYALGKKIGDERE